MDILKIIEDYHSHKKALINLSSYLKNEFGIMLKNDLESFDPLDSHLSFIITDLNERIPWLMFEYQKWADDNNITLKFYHIPFTSSHQDWITASWDRSINKWVVSEIFNIFKVDSNQNNSYFETPWMVIQYLKQNS